MQRKPNLDERGQVWVTGMTHQCSPTKPNYPQNTLNYRIYEQDSIGHRGHLLTLIKRKSLKKNESRIPVSYKPAGKAEFKVGYGGHVQDIYK